MKSENKNDTVEKNNVEKRFRISPPPKLRENCHCQKRQRHIALQK